MQSHLDSQAAFVRFITFVLNTHHIYTCIAQEYFGCHNQDPMSFSNTAAASIRPITRKIFIKSVIADSSRCLASHKSKICSVGDGFVAKY